MQHNIIIKYDNLLLRQLEKKDIELLREWRNNPDNSKYLRQIPYITPEMQESWFERYLQNEDEMAFVIEETKELNQVIGSLSLYDFKESQVEIGKILIGEEKAKGFGYGRKSFVMLLKYAFEKLGKEKVIATVNTENMSARKSYFRIGFEIVGKKEWDNGLIEDVIEINQDILIKNNNFYNEIIF